MRVLLSRSGTLYEAAAATTGARPVAGRGTAYALTTDKGVWLVRHYRRGGALARLLGDRYLRIGSGRAWRELRVSSEARAAGVPTPEVVVAASYKSGLFARFDIAVAWIEGGVDLAAILFGRASPDVQGSVARAAALIETICSRGLRHVDLNLKNILITPAGAYVLDLDRCRMSGHTREQNASLMQRRFVRSLEKWESRTGISLPAPHRRALIEAFRVV